jgi:hypothetical protein
VVLLLLTLCRCDAGLAWCRGDVIARMDADDVCVRGRFEKQVGASPRAPK